MGIKGEANHYMWRGDAVEQGLVEYLHHRKKPHAIAKAMDYFEAQCQSGELTEAIEKEYDAIEGFMEQAITAAQELKLPVPVRVQEPIKIVVEGLQLPLMGYADFSYEEYCLDLKTSNRMPPSKEDKFRVSASHARQFSIYAKARGDKVAKALYVTTGRWGVAELNEDEIDKHFQDVCRHALSIERTIGLVESSEELAMLCPPDFAGFRWDVETINEAKSKIGAWA